MSHNAWVCPFIEGRKSTDDEIFALIVRIFNTTGRIIADGYNASNFITTPSDEVICIDVGFALELNDARPGRRFSETSTYAWLRLKPLFVYSFEQWEDQLPKSTLLVKSLLFIKNHRPDLRDVSFFLSPNEDLETKLKLATKRSPPPSKLQITQALEALDIAASYAETATGGAVAAASYAETATGGAGAAASAEFLRDVSIFAFREGKEGEAHKPLPLTRG